jgi:SAM-dependent methyltransferase
MSEHFNSAYFERRIGNDPKRQLQFDKDFTYVSKFIDPSVACVCDVGCSTGEFLKRVGWGGPRFGMEVSSYARSLAEPYINFDFNIKNKHEFFDVVIFRGTIQYIKRPFDYIEYAHRSLKKNGLIVFLATPNATSPLYYAKQDLPFLERGKMYYIPSERNLVENLENQGFRVLDVSFPYISTPYSNIVKDHVLFLLNLLSKKKFFGHAFWRSSMQIVAVK